MAKKTSFDSIELSSLVQERVKEALQSKDVLNNLVATITESVTRAVVKELKDLLDFNMDEIKELREEIKKRDADHSQLKRELVLSKDELEQYQRRSNLRFFGERPAAMQTGSAGLSNSSLNIVTLILLCLLYSFVLEEIQLNNTHFCARLRKR
uniref:Uncharacterized protein n=1 Tax=Timema bartmani TaxID=61472 RepID=A0A7R9I0E4_9NEOP|nr:unnamed protein product [Timema bartmani]